MPNIFELKIIVHCIRLHQQQNSQNVYEDIVPRTFIDYDSQLFFDK